MKKIFVDIYLAFNLGDDLFLDLLASKYPNCEFTINYLGKNYNQFISEYKNINTRKYTLINKIGQRFKLSNYISNYDKIGEEHDALLFLGGSIFREEDYHGALYQDRMGLIGEFKKRNKPVFILGANFGPFKTEKFFNEYYKLFQLCDDVCFRDLHSYDLFRKLPQVRYAPDIIFQMNVDEYKGLTNKNRVGFSIIDVRHKNGLSQYYDDYIKSTVKTIELLVNKGFECYLMSFCKQEGDLETINTIKSFLSNETLKKIFIYEYNGKLKEAISLIASFNLFIAARFHANIIALLLGIGIMPIIYSPKTANMLQDINHDGILIDMEKLHLQYDESIINSSFNNTGKLHSVINESENQFKVLNKYFAINSVVPEEV